MTDVVTQAETAVSNAAAQVQSAAAPVVADIKTVEAQAAKQWGFIRKMIAARPLTWFWIAFGSGVVLAPYGKQFFELAAAGLTAALASKFFG